MDLTRTDQPFDVVEKPVGYNSHPSGIECIEVTRLCPFDLGNAIKYIWRSEHKNGIEDLKKARWYLKDVLANGLASHPPFKARKLLEQAAAADVDAGSHARGVMLEYLARGQLDDTILLITAIVDGAAQ